jgi:hypothetical protein
VDERLRTAEIRSSTAIAQTLFAPIADLERREHPVPAEEYV